MLCASAVGCSYFFILFYLLWLRVSRDVYVDTQIWPDHSQVQSQSNIERRQFHCIYLRVETRILTVFGSQLDAGRSSNESIAEYCVSREREAWDHFSGPTPLAEFFHYQINYSMVPLSHKQFHCLCR